MTTPIIKIKVTPKSTVKGKLDVRFPANIQTENFLTVTRANGTYTFSVDYTVLTPGPISDPTTAIIAILDQTAGVYKEVSLASLLTSGLDADLQAIAALTGTGILARTADGTWALRTLTAPAAGITITNPAGVAGNPTLVLANDLAALEGISGTNVIPYRSATDTWGTVTISTGLGLTTGTLAITDAELLALAGLVSAADQLPYFTGSGTAALASFPTFGRSIAAAASQAAARTVLALTPGTDVQAFDSDLAALAANASTGLWSVTGSGTGSVRTLTAPAAGITVSNGGGVAGNPTLALANDLAALEGLSSTGIARRTGTDAWSVGTAVALTEIAAQAAYTIVANNTSGSAVPTAMDVTALTSKASPVSADIVLIQDSAASNAFKKTTVGALASAGSVASYNGRTGAVVGLFGDVPVMNYKTGLELSAAGSTTTFGITVGVATDTTNVLMMSLASAYTKVVTSWVVGSGNGSLDTGTVTSNAWYHVFLIARSDTGVVDILTSLSPSAPTMPTNYDRKRRIGSMRTDNSGLWSKFIQIGTNFVWSITVNDVNDAALGTTAVTRALTVPTGIQVTARCRALAFHASAAPVVLVSPLDATDEAPNAVAGNLSLSVTASGTQNSTAIDIRTNTSAQIRTRASAASTTLQIATFGWNDDAIARGL